MLDEILITVTEPDLVPVRGYDDDAGADLKAAHDAIVMPGATERVRTGVRCQIPHHYAGFIFARSGLASRHGIRPANCVGLIDPQFRGEIEVPVHNDSGETYRIRRGDRIAQLVFLYVELPAFKVVDSLPETERGAGGFGSTGV